MDKDMKFNTQVRLQLEEDIYMVYNYLAFGTTVNDMHTVCAQNLHSWPCIGPPPPLLFPAAVEGNTGGHTYNKLLFLISL